MVMYVRKGLNQFDYCFPPHLHESGKLSLMLYMLTRMSCFLHSPIAEKLPITSTSTSAMMGNSSSMTTKLQTIPKHSDNPNSRT